MKKALWPDPLLPWSIILHFVVVLFFSQETIMLHSYSTVQGCQRSISTYQSAIHQYVSMCPSALLFVLELVGVGCGATQSDVSHC